MELLQQLVRQVVAFRPMTVTNSYPLSYQSDAEREQVQGCVEAVENLVLHLTRVLSDGLYAGLDLWSVLQTLDRLDNRLPSGEAKALYRFAPQLVLLIKSSMPRANEFIKTKAFLRLALSSGCLLSSLELLAVYNEDIVTSYMMEHALIRSRGTTAWDRFVRSVSQISGPPLEMITPGFTRAPQIVPLDLQPAVAVLDDNAERIQQQKLYVSALLSTVPPFAHPDIPVRPRTPQRSHSPAAASVGSPVDRDEMAKNTQESSEATTGKKIVKRVVRKRTVIRKVLRPNAGGASSIGDESETRSQNPSSFVGGSDNEQDANDDEAGIAASDSPQMTQVMTRRQYISSETIGQLLDHHRQHLRALGETCNDLEAQMASLLLEGTAQGWYFDIDEHGANCDHMLRCSVSASNAIDAALSAVELLVMRRRQVLLDHLEQREAELMAMEDLQ